MSSNTSNTSNTDNRQNETNESAKALTFTIAYIAAIILGMFVGIQWQKQHGSLDQTNCMHYDTILVAADTVFRTITDTAPKPAAERTDSKERINIAMQGGKAHTERVCVETDTMTTDTATADTTNKYTAADTAAIITLPVTQRTYTDSLFELQVSGIDPRLDWIKVNARTITQTKLLKPTATPAATHEHTKPWAFGIQGGYGFGKDGFTPYIGLGVQYTLLRW